MLAYATDGDLKDNAYDVLPTLFAMGQNDTVTSDIQRHIVRAIDNLSAFGKLRVIKGSEVLVLIGALFSFG